MLQVRGNKLQQVENFKYLGVVFTNEGKRNKEINTRIGKTVFVLSELYHFVVTELYLSKAANMCSFY